MASDFESASSMREFHSSRVRQKENCISTDTSLTSTEVLVSTVRIDESMMQVKNRVEAIMKMLS